MSKKPELLILLGIIFYLVLALSVLHRPLIGDDASNAYAVATKVGTLEIWHPPLYHQLLRALIRVGGIANENLRLVGVACFLLSIYLIYLICRQLSRYRGVGILACVLYALHPLAIQGSLILDIDITILPVILLMFMLYFLRTYESRQLKSVLFWGLLFFIGLWAKLSTPVLLVASIFLFYLFRGKIKEALVKTAITLAVGISLFLALWYLYALVHNLRFLEVFERSFQVFSRFSGGPSFLGLEELALRISRIYLWVGPYFLILWAGIGILRLKDYLLGKREMRSMDFLILNSLLVFFAYIFIGGTCLSFAKYHYPIISIICIIIAEFVFSLKPLIARRRLLSVLALGLGFIVLERLWIGDLLYRVNYILRELVIFSPQSLNSFCFDFIRRMAVYHLPFIIGIILFYFVGRNRAKMIKDTALLLLTLIFFSNVSLALRQVKADYFTTYCYGRSISQFQQMEGYIRQVHSRNPQGIIVGPEDVLYNAIGHYYFGYTYNLLWNKPERFLSTVKEKEVVCVAYAFTWNAVHSFKKLFSEPAIRKALETEYNFYPRGEYSVWLRR